MIQRNVETITATTSGVAVDQSELPSSIRYFAISALNLDASIDCFVNTAPLDANAKAETLPAGQITPRFFGKFAAGTAVRIVSDSSTADVRVVLYSLDDEG